jgi:aminopeptidase-like protein
MSRGAVAPDPATPGAELHQFVTDLYPLCRSITGNGVRRTLALVGQQIPLTLHEIPSGTPVLDWTVPLEWNITDACVKTLAGERVIDFAASNLHVVGYSEPVRARVSRAELDARLFSLPERPDWIPYRTSYYERTWGFCVSQRQRDRLTESEYDVVVEASLEPGHLTIGECVLPGEVPEEVLLSCHVCHPSLCNDNLSGIAVATFLARRLASRPRRLTYRFLFIPGTIGSIAWLARNEALLPRIRHGLVLTCLGDGGAITYKRSRRDDADVDRAAEHVLRHAGAPYAIEPFSPWGYDERQYCSPGFDLPVGCLMRTPHGRFPEYHTSADNLDFVRPDALADSLDTCAAILQALDRNREYVNLSPKGEPQLGKRGLYSAIGGVPDAAAQKMAMLWVLNYSDGHHSLLDIANRSGLAFASVADAAELLARHQLLSPNDR